MRTTTFIFTAAVLAIKDVPGGILESRNGRETLTLSSTFLL